MPTIIKCRAKDPNTCAYHGKNSTKSLHEKKLATLMEAAAANYDLETYHQYHLELDALQGKLTIYSDPIANLDERIAALPIQREETFSLTTDDETDPHGDDANLAERNRYTLVRDNINWRTFADLTVQEQEDCFWLTRNDDQTQLQVAEYGDPDTQALLARVGGSWVTDAAWQKLLTYGNPYVQTQIRDNPDAPQTFRDKAADSANLPKF